jgi:iron complex outermembrane recepter protein
MIYATWSTGFRPGGINRSVAVAPYNADYLSNFEVGTKTSWFEHRLRVNGAIFDERWKDAQFAYPGPQGVNVVINAGRAEIKGVEADVHWRATEGLTLSTSATFLDAKLLTNVCHYEPSDANCSPTEDHPNNSVFAPTGSRLPVSSKFKGNTIARYEWSTGDYRAHAQAAAVYQTNALSALRPKDEAVTGPQPGYATFDFAVGVGRASWTTEFYVANAFDNRGQSIRYTTCATSTCQLVNVIPVRPRLIGLTFGERF